MYIYRFRGLNNETLYIGKASDINQRFANHNHLPKECYENIKVIEVAEVETYDDMDLIERYLIAKENPTFNDKHSNKYITFNIPCADNLKFEKYSGKILKTKNKEESKEEQKIISFLEKVCIFKERSLYGGYLNYTVTAKHWNEMDMYLSEKDIDAEAYCEDTKYIKGEAFSVITLKPYISKKININKLRSKERDFYYEVEIDDNSTDKRSFMDMLDEFSKKCNHDTFIINEINGMTFKICDKCGRGISRLG